MSGQDQQRRRGHRAPSGDWGRTVARLLCILFALIGAVPLAGGLLLRSKPLHQWAASETSRVLRQQLGIEATFSVEMSLIPLRLAITDLEVPSNDGGGPAVVARVAAISPRFFSLLAGRIDVGDIELENPNVRLVIEDGAVRNVSYRFPQTRDGKPPELRRAPFRSLSITGANLDVTVDGAHIKTEGIDLDAFAEPRLSFDVAMRVAGAQMKTRRVLSEETGAVAEDEDRLCAVDLRLFLSKEEIEIKRMSVTGALDLDPAPQTPPRCGTTGPEQIALRLSQTHIKLPRSSEKMPLAARGHVMTRLPLALLERLKPGLDAEGWVGFSGDIRVTPETHLPEVIGKISGENLSMNEFTIAKEIKIDLVLTGDVVNVPKLYAQWGNGEAWFEEIKVEPFTEKMPLSIEKVTTKEIDFPGVMREVAVTRHAWVDWNFGNTVLNKVRGTLKPFYIDGGVTGQTHDFVVWDRGFDDPTHKRMIGIPRANVVGRWRAHEDALEFYDAILTFGSSRLPVDLVSVGFFNKKLIVRLEEGGGPLDLADVSPIADIELRGKSDIFVDLEGPREHPILKGDLSVDGLSIDGFEAGDILESEVHFEPLFVEFNNLKGQKASMDYQLSTARLSFDGPAKVEFTAAATSNHFDVEEFFRVFHFDEDPRFEGISGTGKVHGQVRYLLGGPEDTCSGGRLFVNGNAILNETEFIGESFNEGTAQFSFEWFDMDAGTHGMRVNVPSLSLEKGSGTIFASAQIQPGGLITGDVVATRVPISRIDSLGEVFQHADGFVTGTAELNGTVDALSMTSQLEVTRLKAGDVELPPSSLSADLEPIFHQPDPASVVGTSGCGRTIYAPYGQGDYQKDLSDGDFIINGSLLGGQLQVSNLSISRQRNKVVKGTARVSSLDLGKLGRFLTGGKLSAGVPKGTISGEARIDELLLSDPYASRAELSLSETAVGYEGIRVALLDDRARIILKDRSIRSENLSLVATTATGEKAILDAQVVVNDNNQLDATLDLRPTNLGVLTPALPGVERAEGALSASLALKGPVTNPTWSGYVKVEDGKLRVSGFSTPISDLYLTVGLDQRGLHVVEGRGLWGGGKLALQGSAPLVGDRFGRTNLAVAARGVLLPLDDGVNVAFDADLSLLVPAPSSTDQELPKLTGTVDLLSASYEKAMKMTADISTLAARGEKTDVEVYDPAEDNLEIDVLIRSSKPLRVKNELVVADLRIDPTGLRLTGTDQRFGAVGTVEIEKGGQVFLRRNEFEIQRGLVRFNDPTRLHPEVDVSAVTEYRRYADRSSSQGNQQASAAAPGGGGPVAGNWRIVMRAYGPPEDLKVDLNSDPPLAQDDIFLLLTVGLTRTELDQTQNSGVGSAVALEALGSLSGAESAVTKTVPVDEFRFGSSYSSRTGRTEPTLTIGKRLSRRIRASVTTNLGDSSEVRSRVEYRATESLSLEASYDNANDLASTTGGNLGGDVRWRLEFQ